MRTSITIFTTIAAMTVLVLMMAGCDSGYDRDGATTPQDQPGQGGRSSHLGQAMDAAEGVAQRAEQHSQDVADQAENIRP